jgi:hypothetical protein
MAEEKKVREGYEIQRPNREKASSKSMKAIVVLLLLVSVALMVIITVGGWDKLAGAQPVQIAYIAIYLICAFYILRWSRGVLPMVAALAIILGIFAAVAGPAWFDRDKAGFTDPALDASMLGLLTFLIVPVQLLLIAAAMSAFSQAWSVEVEVKEGETYDPDRHDEPDTGSVRGKPASA